VCEKSVEMRHFLDFPYPEEAAPNLSGPLRSLGMERMKRTAPTEALGYTLDGGEEAKTEILVNPSGRSMGRWRSEETSNLLAFCEQSIPRFARNDARRGFFNKLLETGNVGSGKSPPRLRRERIQPPDPCGGAILKYGAR